MPARVERFPLTQRPRRGILKPVLGWALVAAAVAVVRRYTRQPSLPRMSDEWLRSYLAQHRSDQY